MVQLAGVIGAVCRLTGPTVPPVEKRSLTQPLIFTVPTLVSGGALWPEADARSYRLATQPLFDSVVVFVVRFEKSDLSEALGKLTTVFRRCVSGATVSPASGRPGAYTVP